MEIIRFALLAVSTLLACYLGFLHFDGFEAVPFIKHAGYWVIFTAFALFIWNLGLEIRRIWREGWRPARNLLAPACFIGFASLGLYLLQPAGYKIVMDEPVLAETALQMHEERTVLVPTRAYKIGDQFMLLEGYVDKRRFFYPFLVSLLHDLTGYRSLQGVVLNFLLTPIFISLLFWVGRLIWPHWGGYCSVLLFLTVPLLAMNVNCGGFDLLNLTMILVTGLAGVRYLTRPDTVGLNLLVFSCVLLAHTRYESALYVPAAAVIVLLGWWRLRRPQVTWAMGFVPLIMVTIPQQKELLDQSPVLWQLETESTAVFSIERIPDNLAHAAVYFFNFGPFEPNSLLLSLLFVGALPLGAILVLAGNVRPGLRLPFGQVGIVFASVILCSFFLLMSYHWGQLDNTAATRIALPFILFQVCFVIWVCGSFQRLRYLGPVLVLLALGFFLGVTRPVCAKTDFLMRAWELHLADWLRDRAVEFESLNPLFISDPSGAAIAERMAAIPEKYAAEHKAELEFHRKLGTFSDIFFVTRVVVDPANPALKKTVSPLDRDFEMEVLREEKLTKQYYVRFARMTGVRWRSSDRRQVSVELDGNFLFQMEALKLFTKTLP